MKEEQMSQMPTKTIKEAKETLNELILWALKDGLDIPVFLWGGPGIGKSSIIRQIVEEIEGLNLDDNFIDLRLQQLEPVDLRGIPGLDEEEGVSRWSPPGFLPQEGKGVLFLDELNLAPTAVQKAAYQLVFQKELGDYEMPEGWMIISAGNRSGDKAFVNPMPKPLANRFLHFEVLPNLEDWKDWAYEVGIRSDIIGFLNFKSDMLYKFDPEKSEQTFPTPRTWERVSNLMDLGLDAEEDVAAAIGEGAAAEFMTFLEIKEDLPDVDQIFQGENEIPEKPDVLSAVISSMVAKAKNNPDLSERVMEYANEIPEKLVEFSIVLVKDAIRAGVPVQKTEAFQRFANDKKDFVL